MDFASPAEKHIYELARLIGRIQGVLGTTKTGDELVEIVRSAHKAELKLATLKEKEEA